MVTQADLPQKKGASREIALVQQSRTEVPEGYLRCCASGWLAPRRGSAPTARRKDLCRSVSSPEYSCFPAPHGEPHLFRFFPARPTLLHMQRDQKAPAMSAAVVDRRRNGQLHS